MAKECIADVHSHILPKVDDGATGTEEALAMLRKAEEEGITHLICTPHYKNHRRSVERDDAGVLLEKLKKKAQEQDININLYLGNEVFYYSKLDDAIEAGKIATMNQSDFMLVEFHPCDSFDAIRNGLNHVYELGFQPILAHVERYECLTQKYSYAEELHDAGVKFQVNTDSLVGDRGFATKRFIHKLLKDQLVDYVGTDAHDAKKRCPQMEKCRNRLYRKYDEEYVNQILFENAAVDFKL